MNDLDELSRRGWLGVLAGAVSVAALGSQRSVVANAGPRPRVAAIITEFTLRSHAHVILENFLTPYLFNGQATESGMDVVSLYVDQFPAGRDMARDIAKQFQIAIYPTIAEALRCGGNELAVDGVLSIAEHGEYPTNDHWQKMYPRKRFFDEITAVFRQSGRVVPLFNDKHLSYRWDWSVEMMQAARDLKIPLMAGSSVPLAQRRPVLELPNQAVIDEAISIHGGPLEAYDFHALEVLQSIVESRRGGETGVIEIQFLEDDAVWKAAEEGRWSYSLAAAAMRATEGRDAGSLREFVETPGGGRHPVHAILIKYRDGLRATVLRIGANGSRWGFACRLAGASDPLATSFYVGPWHNRNLFKALSHAIQSHIRNKRAPYPAERTHLVTGILASAMDSHFEKNRLLQTPHLNVSYQPTDFRAMREMGDTWDLITEETVEPMGIEPVGIQLKKSQ